VIAGPTLAESKLAIGLTAMMILLGSSFCYMAFHLPYPSDMFDSTSPGQNVPIIQNRTGNSTSRVWPLTLTSPVFSESGGIPARYMCAGGTDDTLPPLQWNNVPSHTAAFALIVHDFEPRSQTMVDDIAQRMIWNIPGDRTQLPEDEPVAEELPDGTLQSVAAVVATDAEGSCSHQGISVRYAFELFALDEKLDCEPGTTRNDLLKAMQGHITGHAMLTGLSRK
jgi:Raf kinase inhibitor-like YbhB/YbcL family protein